MLKRVLTSITAGRRLTRGWLAASGLALIALSLILLPVGVAARVDPSALGALVATATGVRPAGIGNTTWYFAEGYTGTGFDEYLTINNPGGTAGLAHITYYVEGEPSVDRTVSLPANSRVTVAVHNAYNATTDPGSLGRKTAGHSTKVTTTVPTIIERPMYFTYNSTVTGGHNVIGATTPARVWSFAEGFTGTGFDEYLTMMNPGGTAGTATITYYVEGELTPTVRTVTLPANSRVTVPVHVDYNATTNPGGLGRKTGGHSTKVAADVDIVVERPMYFTYNTTITGGHNVMGAQPSAATTCRAVLLGTSEVPPVAPSGRGEIALTIDSATGQVRADWLIAGMTSNITAAHIHEAAVGVNGPVRVNFGTLPVAGGAFKTTTASTATQTEAILANPSNFYVNVHTTTNPNGEIRGQLDCTPPVICLVTMNGASEVPPVNPAGSGAARLRIDAATGQIRGEWLVRDMTSNITAAHIHPGAAGVNNPPLITFNNVPAAGGLFSTLDTATTTQAANIVANPSNFYVNIHTVNNSTGEIRGQLSCPA